MLKDKKFTFVYIIIIGAISLLLQIFFIPLIEIALWRPDLILLFTIFIGYRYGVIYGTLTGFILGIFQDSIGPGTMGFSPLANCIVGFLAGQIRQLKLAYNVKILVTILLILIHGIIFYLFYQFRTDTSYSYLILTRVFPNTIYTFGVGMLLSLFFKTDFEGA
jgi:rod shape-determining protein MreD